MSGGVDSSLAAALLIEQGYDVVGLTMDLSSVRRSLVPESAADAGNPAENGARGKDVEDAAAVARALNIPHRMADISREFRRRVVDNFVSEYRQGRTPNPCIRCNETVKFSLLLEIALEMGADGLATGHYAGIAEDPKTGRRRVRKGRDRDKDQSYFLYRLNQEQLSRVVFPIGEMTKPEVREQAKRRGLATASRRAPWGTPFRKLIFDSRTMAESPPEFEATAMAWSARAYTMIPWARSSAFRYSAFTSKPRRAKFSSTSSTSMPRWRAIGSPPTTSLAYRMASSGDFFMRESPNVCASGRGRLPSPLLDSRFRGNDSK